MTDQPTKRIRQLLHATLSRWSRAGRATRRMQARLRARESVAQDTMYGLWRLHGLRSALDEDDSVLHDLLTRTLDNFWTGANEDQQEMDRRFSEKSQ